MPDLQNLKRDKEQQLNHSEHSDNLSARNKSSHSLNSQPESVNTNQTVNSEYYQLNNQSNDSQQIHADQTPKSQLYESFSQRQILQNTQQSLNEQRGQYTQQAFNDYESQQEIQQPQYLQQVSQQEIQQPQYLQQISQQETQQPQPLQQIPYQEQPQPTQPQQHYDYEKEPEIEEESQQAFQNRHYEYGEQQGRSDTTHKDVIGQNRSSVSATTTEFSDTYEDGQSKPGTVEVPDRIKKISDKIHKDRLKQDKIYGRLKETKTKSSRTLYEKKQKELKEVDQEERLHETEKGTRRIKQEKKKRLHDKKGDDNDNRMEEVPHGNQDKKGDDNDNRLKGVPHGNQDKKGKKKHLYDRKQNTESDVRNLHEAVDDVLYGKGRLRHRQRNDTGEDAKEEEKFSRVDKRAYSVGRLKFEKRTTYEKLTRSEYDKNVKKRDKRNFKKRVKGRLIQDKAKSILDDDSIQQDDLSRDYSMALKRGYRMTDYYVRRKTKYLRDTYNPYARLQALAQRERYHMDQQKRLQDNMERNAQKDKLREAATKEERKRMKKEMQKHRVEKEGNFIRRTANQFKMTKRSVAYKQQLAKKTVKTLGAVCGIIGVFLPVLIIVVLIVMGFTQGAVEYYSTAVIQVGYGDITDATEYFRNLETDLDEYLSEYLSDRDELEDELQDEYGPDIYEFNYDLAEFGFSANTLVAYLAAKYGVFELDDDIKDELQEIFDEMYVFSIYTTMEEREIEEDTSELKKICYIKLIKKELEDVVEQRLTEEQLKQYRGYKLSTGGQQVYGPVMKENWSNKISSNFGDRIHPITGERKQHKGVDIAVPVGTKLYSPVKGKVTTAKYSDSAGYMVVIKDSKGWTVTFMHMDGFVVRNGQKIERGDFVGESGNTGNSTGPHLHLQVNDSSGNPINPIFIIPQTCVVISTDETE